MRRFQKAWIQFFKALADQLFCFFMQISWNSCIQRNRLTQQRTNSYTTFGATGGFGYTGERCKSRCNRGVDQVRISRSGEDQVHIRVRLRRLCQKTNDVRHLRNLPLYTNGVLHRWTISKSWTSHRHHHRIQEPWKLGKPLLDLVDEKVSRRRDGSLMNYQRLHWSLPIFNGTGSIWKGEHKICKKNVLSTSNIRRLCRRGFFLESRTLLNKPWGCLIPLDESQPGEKPTPKTNILHTSLQYSSSSLLLFTYSSDEGKSYRQSWLFQLMEVA